MLVAGFRSPVFDHALSYPNIAMELQPLAEGMRLLLMALLSAIDLHLEVQAVSFLPQVCVTEGLAFTSKMMGFPKSLVSIQQRDVDHSDSGSEDFSPREGLKTIYSGISVSFTTQTTAPRRIGMFSVSRRHYN